jgi:hypothetical protein
MNSAGRVRCGPGDSVGLWVLTVFGELCSTLIPYSSKRLTCNLFPALGRGNRLKGRTALIVPNYSDFEKRNRKHESQRSLPGSCVFWRNGKLQTLAAVPGDSCYPNRRLSNIIRINLSRGPFRPLFTSKFRRRMFKPN